MASINSSLLLVATLFAVTVICLENDTTGASETSKEPKPSGALASLGRMIIDIPLGVVEAFKDGAEVIESVVIAIVRGIFA